MMRISLKNILYFFLLCSVSVQAQRVELDSVFLSRLPILFPQIKAVNLRSPALKPNLDMVLTKKEMPTKLIPKTNGVNFWTNQNNLVLQINEATFSNWNAGGNNSVSALAVLGFVRKYKFRYLQW
ncbi:MAG: DUF3078 domain-containing protein, partial [Flavobacteriaceae bacterium]|nr:DUF3078 domain-containing protein [Flavobacteriaceae bacterium]